MDCENYSVDPDQVDLYLPTMDHNDSSLASGPAFGFPQRLHLGLLIAVLVEYALLMAFSESADGIREQLTLGIAIFTAAWGALLTAGSIYYGKEDTLKLRLFASYRAFLGRPLYLWAFNCLMLVASTGLLYLLLNYRQVDFYSEQPVNVLTNYAGVQTNLGILKAKTPTRLRMKLGHAAVTFIDPGATTSFQATSIDVLPFWYASQLPQMTAVRVVPKVVNPSDLILGVVNTQQAVPVVVSTHSFLDGSIYFDTLEADLALSHSELGALPISIYRLGLETEKLPVGQGIPPPPSYSIDLLGEKPHGINELKRYFFTLSDNAASARYLGGLLPGDAKAVHADNILESDAGAESVDITPDGTDAHTIYKMTVQAKTPGLYRFRFIATYDIAGQQRSGHSTWVYLYTH